MGFELAEGDNGLSVHEATRQSWQMLCYCCETSLGSCCLRLRGRTECGASGGSGGAAEFPVHNVYGAVSAEMPAVYENGVLEGFQNILEHWEASELLEGCSRRFENIGLLEGFWKVVLECSRTSSGPGGNSGR